MNPTRGIKDARYQELSSKNDELSQLHYLVNKIGKKYHEINLHEVIRKIISLGSKPLQSELNYLTAK